jgi:uncharacterized membrane protein YphA (DoxX/SURF4 family)
MARLIGILVLIAVILTIIDVWQKESSLEKRLLWIVVIILLPIIGSIAWYIVSSKNR